MKAAAKKEVVDSGLAGGYCILNPIFLKLRYGLEIFPYLYSHSGVTLNI